MLIMLPLITLPFAGATVPHVIFHDNRKLREELGNQRWPYTNFKYTSFHIDPNEFYSRQNLECASRVASRKGNEGDEG